MDADMFDILSKPKSRASYWVWVALRFLSKADRLRIFSEFCLKCGNEVPQQFCACMYADKK